MSRTVSLALLVTIFATLALAEQIWSARQSARNGDRRLGVNFSLGTLSIAMSSLLPVGAIAAAELSSGLRYPGLRLNQLPFLIDVCAVYVALSFVNYWLHRLAHRTPWLWRFHRVHHTDEEIDLSTALRNHPVEVVASLLLSSATAFVVGPDPFAVAIAQTALFAQNMWSHANIRLRPGTDQRLAVFVITPAVHCMHHSADRPIADSNYSESLTIWDRLFGTWRDPTDVPRFGAERTVVR